MKTRMYIKPETVVIKVQTQAILAGSEIKMASDSDYDSENLDDCVDDEGNLWID